MTASTQKVWFNYLVKINLPQRRIIKSVVETILRQHDKRPSAINYIFCSDDYLLEINRTYLKHNYYTDIVTFDLSDKDGWVRADIYISVDRVRENALAMGISNREEVMRVIFHGALHLCGYKDKRKSESSRMREAEDYYLKLVYKRMRV